MLRMRDRGIPHLNGHGRGDQLVRINIWVPQRLNSREKELLRELAQSEHLNPSEDDRRSASKGFFEKVRDAFS
jgi:molecular chaperone DnaJ